MDMSERVIVSYVLISPKASAIPPIPQNNKTTRFLLYFSKRFELNLKSIQSALN
jgi:hypothetical protein